jgi:hypothetical protein
MDLYLLVIGLICFLLPHYILDLFEVHVTMPLTIIPIAVLSIRS